MIDYIRKKIESLHFFKKNKFNDHGVFELIKDIIEKVKANATVTVSPHNYDEQINWHVIPGKKSTKFIALNKSLSPKSFDKFLLNYVAKHGSLIVIFKNHLHLPWRNELWGYRLMLIDSEVMLHPISHTELYDGHKTHDASTFYCGPDGKIDGSNLNVVR